MIIKNFELKKINLKDNKYFLLYGNNEGLIEETIEEILKPNLSKNIYNYEESDILKNIEDFKENLLNKSFFENEKLIIIKRISDKFFKIIEKLVSKNIEDLSIFIISSGLSQSGNMSGLFCVNTLFNGLLITRSINSLKALRIWANAVPGLHTGNNSISTNGYLPNILLFNRDVGVSAQLYLNGILKMAGSGNGPYMSNFTNGIALIGKAPGYQYFKGSIAEIIIFKKVFE